MIQIDQLPPGTPAEIRYRPPSVQMRRISKLYRIYHNRSVSLKQHIVARLRGQSDVYEQFLALDDVSLDIPRGQVMGIMGRNGSGKSTLLKILARVIEPDSGEVRVRGRVSAILELGAGFQPELSGRRNISLYGSLLGLGRQQIKERTDEIIAFAELERFIDNPVRHYSSGMYLRLAFAIGAHVDADVLLFDEVLAVGDAGFRKKCVKHMLDLKEAGKTIVLVSHGPAEIEAMCDRALLLVDGRVAVDDSPTVVGNRYESLLA